MDTMLTRKIGPLPMWGWGAIGLGGALGYSLLTRAKAGKADATTSADAASSGVPADQVPDFISQVTVNNPLQPPDDTSTSTTPPTNPTKTTGTVTIPAPPTTKPKSVITYKVKHGDTLAAIAKKYGYSANYLWAYNVTAGNRDPKTIAVLKKHPGRFTVGETIVIPQFH